MSAQVPAPLSIGINADQAVKIAPHGHRDFVIKVVPNRPLRLSLVQGEHFQKLTLPGRGIKGPIRTNDAGLGAAIVSTLAPATGEVVEYCVTIESYHNDEESEGRLLVEAEPLSANDARRKAEAEGIFYDAEFLRRGKNAKKWPRAREEFESALLTARALGDVLLEQRILTEESRLMLFRLNQYLEAHETAAKAVALSPSAETSSLTDHSILATQALAVKTLGSTDYYLADYPSAIKHSTQALDIYRALHDRYWEGVLLGNLAYVYLESGDSSNALTTAEQALATAEQLHDDYGRIFTLEALGSIHSARGELGQSFASYQQALGVLQQAPYPAVEAGVWRGLGRFYKDAGKADAAEEAYEHAIKTAHDASDSAALLESTSEMADLERSQGKLKASHASYTSALSVALEAGLLREAVLLKAGLARTLGAEGQAGEATRQAREAMAQATSIGFIEGEAAAALDLADLEFSFGHRAAAREAYSGAESIFTEANERTQAAYAISRMARIDVDLGKLELAERESSEALSLIERTRSMVPGRELRTSYFADQQRVYKLSIQLMLRLDQARPGRGYAARAFEIVEMARARSLTDQAEVGSGPASSGNGASGQTVACEQRLSAAYHRLPDLYLTSDNASYRIVQTRQQIQSLVAQCDALESLDRKAGSHGVATLATVAQVQRSMGSQKASLLEFWLGDTESVCWYVTGDRFRVVRLPPRREIERRVEALNQAILSRQELVAGEDMEARVSRIHRVDDQTSALLLQLGTTLLRPLAGRQQKLLYVIPDGKLASLPFPALTDPSTNAALIEHADVVEEPSSSLLLQLLRRESAQQKADRAAPRRVVVFADPLYSESDERLLKSHPGLTQVSQISSPALPRLDRLSASSTEAAFIGRLSGASNADLHLGSDASAKLMLATEWSDYQIMHLAVHALLGASPTFTGIAFTMVDAKGRHEDGMLWLNQIYQLHGVPEMVFLSGCQTAEGRNVPGEGIASLANAFLYAGARSAIGSLWSVEDDASSELVQDFYTNLLRRHLPPSVSLRRAQLALAQNPRYRSPYYWAAFQLEGLSGSTLHATR
ncbi:CHAT domain-containing tetratricopeptide repeat protein [Granulicella sibirica]|uniref:CHAT domain-containing tetratricopeptide repeat protein n=1 Tax=Granulicella sibirica TaxID=2479048 RepID=UPI0013755183|nr:CHAT domain-containing protein [Granulicella sibirica]